MTGKEIWDCSGSGCERDAQRLSPIRHADRNGGNAPQPARQGDDGACAAGRVVDPDVRNRIADPTGEAPGTIVVDTTQQNLYYVLPGKQAIQYKVATGAEAYGWTGRATSAT